MISTYPKQDGVLEPDLNEESHQRFLALQKSERQLRDTCERKDRFIAVVSHELRNMLAPVVMILGAHAHTNQSDSGLLNVAAEHAKQLSRLIDDLLDASRLASGKFQLNRETIDLRNIAKRSVQAVTPAVKERSQELLVTPYDAPLWLDADSLRIEQILLNLLSNAIKHTPEGGCIWLRLGRDDDSAVAQVRDSGCGIRAELIPGIFDIFSRADDGIHHVSGLGIGLAMVKSLVELHGGTVEAHSEGPGCGADFTVRLPLHWR